MSACSPTAKNDLRLLDPRRVRLRRDGFDRLHLEIGFEERYGPVHAVRCLPLTRPEELVSIQDEEGDEIGIIADLGPLDAESRKALDRELELYYLRPHVTAIRRIENKNGIHSWDVETDIGPRTVHIRDRQHIRPLSGGRTLLTDIHEVRYEVPPPEQLDERSRHWLEIEL